MTHADEKRISQQAQDLIRDAGDMADDMRHAWEERIAICMIDGGLPLCDAMRVAFDQIKEMSCKTSA